jgi:hypothetical protein
LFGGADEDEAVEDEAVQPVPEVSGVVAACFVRPSDAERVASGWEPALGRFARARAASLALSADPHAPGLHPFAVDIDGAVSDAPSERGLLCQVPHCSTAVTALFSKVYAYL